MNEVLFVINTMGRAGAEKSLISLLRLGESECNNIKLLAILPRGEMFSELPDSVTVLNKNISVKPILGFQGAFYIVKEVLRRFLTSTQYVKNALRLFKCILLQLHQKCLRLDKALWFLLADSAEKTQIKYNVAIAYLEGASTYYVADQVNARTKIAFVHVNYGKAGYTRELDFDYYAKFDHILCVSAEVCYSFINVYPEFKEKVKVFHNIVTRGELFKAASVGKGFRDAFSGTKILTIARLHHQKGLDLAVSAMEKLVRMGYRDLKWYVIGEGSERSKLNRIIKQKGLTNIFILLGEKSNPYPYLAECDIYVQSSRYEGWGIALQEALLLNKPVITTSVDGIPSLLTNMDNALISPICDDGLANAVRLLLDNPALMRDISEKTKELSFDFSEEEKLLDLLIKINSSEQ